MPFSHLCCLYRSHRQPYTPYDCLCKSYLHPNVPTFDVCTSRPTSLPHVVTTTEDELYYRLPVSIPLDGRDAFRLSDFVHRPDLHQEKAAWDLCP